MGRLRKEFIDLVDAFADRILDVVNATRRRDCPAFVRDQLGRSGTSVGSNVSEGHEALTVPEFRHRLGVALRELGETKYWLRMAARRTWVRPTRLGPLQDEADQITRILTTIILRSDPGSAERDTADGHPATALS
jgi:four helix bundle protein